MFSWLFSSTKVANIGQQGNQAVLFICVWLNYANHYRDSSAMMDYWWKFSTSDRHRKLNQLRLAKYVSLSYKWNILATKETSNAPNLSNLKCVWLKYPLPFLFFPTLSRVLDQPTPLAQRARVTLLAYIVDPSGRSPALITPTGSNPPAV